MVRTRVKTIARNSSAPVLSQTPEHIQPRRKWSSESSEQKDDPQLEPEHKTVVRGLSTRKVTGIQRLQSVDEGSEGD